MLSITQATLPEALPHARGAQSPAPLAGCSGAAQTSEPLRDSDVLEQPSASAAKFHAFSFAFHWPLEPHQQACILLSAQTTELPWEAGDNSLWTNQRQMGEDWGREGLFIPTTNQSASPPYTSPPRFADISSPGPSLGTEFVLRPPPCIQQQASRTACSKERCLAL